METVRVRFAPPTIVAGQRFSGRVVGVTHRAVLVEICCDGSVIDGLVQVEDSGLSVGDRVEVAATAWDRFRERLDLVLWDAGLERKGGVMSVNLNLGVVVRDYRPERAPAIERAVREVLVRSEISEDLPPLAETTDAGGRCLVSRSARPVSITGAYEWAMGVEKELREATAAANGGPCRVQFRWDDADEGREEDDGE